MTSNFSQSKTMTMSDAKRLNSFKEKEKRQIILKNCLSAPLDPNDVFFLRNILNGDIIAMKKTDIFYSPSIDRHMTYQGYLSKGILYIHENFEDGAKRLRVNKKVALLYFLCLSIKDGFDFKGFNNVDKIKKIIYLYIYYKINGAYDDSDKTYSQCNIERANMITNNVSFYDIRNKFTGISDERLIECIGMMIESGLIKRDNTKMVCYVLN